MPVSIGSYITDIAAGKPRKPSPIASALQALSNWANGNIVDADVKSNANIAISKTELGAYTAYGTVALTVRNSADSSDISKTTNLARFKRLGPEGTLEFDLSGIANPGGTGIYIILPVAARNPSPANIVCKGIVFITGTGITQRAGFATIIGGNNSKALIRLTDLSTLPTDASLAVNGTIEWEI